MGNEDFPTCFSATDLGAYVNNYNIAGRGSTTAVRIAPISANSQKNYAFKPMRITNNNKAILKHEINMNVEISGLNNDYLMQYYACYITYIGNNLMLVL